MDVSITFEYYLGRIIVNFQSFELFLTSTFVVPSSLWAIDTSSWATVGDFRENLKVFKIHYKD